MTRSEEVEPSTSNAEEWYYKRLSTSPFRPPIFLSYSTPTNEQQFVMVEAVYKTLARNQLATWTLGVNEYDFKAPLKAVRRLITASHGFLAIAFSKTTVVEGVMARRRGRQPPTEEVLANVALTSPWVQIEAAMAFQRQLPILILREKGVVGDGLLESGVISQNMPEFDLDKSPADYLRSEDFRAAMSIWRDEIRAKKF
jgi:hypothetical protein